MSSIHSTAAFPHTKRRSVRGVSNKTVQQETGNSMISVMLLPVFIIAGFGEGTPQQDSIGAKFGPMVDSCSKYSRFSDLPKKS